MGALKSLLLIAGLSALIVSTALLAVGQLSNIMPKSPVKLVNTSRRLVGFSAGLLCVAAVYALLRTFIRLAEIPAHPWSAVGLVWGSACLAASLLMTYYIILRKPCG